MSWWEAVGAAVGTSVGQWDANKKNWKIAKKQMQFQREMSNTAVQRRMEDMRLAGINPLLAGQHEASSPAGATATMQNAVGQGISSAMQAMQLKTAIKKANAEVDNTKANTAYVKDKHNIIKPGGVIGKMLSGGIKGIFGENPDTKGVVENIINMFSDKGFSPESLPGVSQPNVPRFGPGTAMDQAKNNISKKRERARLEKELDLKQKMYEKYYRGKDVDDKDMLNTIKQLQFELRNLK